MNEIPLFNPLDKKNLGPMIAEKLLAQERKPMPPSEAFEGAGVYAIYYFGPFELYSSLASKNRVNDGSDVPIYVGKAVPAGSRKGGVGWDVPPGQAIFKRLKDHAKSIDAARNLDLADFFCRYLAVDDVWISLGESMLIEMCRPLWNRVDGFGNHDPGSGRHKGKLSDWDVIHPGRKWSSNLAPGREAWEIEADINALLTSAALR